MEPFFNQDDVMNTVFRSLVAGLAFAVCTGATAADTMSVADLHARRAELGGAQVSIAGTVIKVNNGIMRRNFVHVQDGTGSGDTDRVIFTSAQTAKVGDKIVATGTVNLNVDFGMGYHYAVLVEQATFTPAK